MRPAPFARGRAAGTSYSNHAIQMIPFYIYYSMFGFQRIGRFHLGRRRHAISGLSRRRYGRANERWPVKGCEHQDGHSLLLSSTVPNCVSYDPAYAYELAVIIHDGLRRMIENQENVFYYITCMNENYVHPPMPKGVEDGILKGLYLTEVGGRGKVRVQLIGAGTILREVRRGGQAVERRLRGACGHLERDELQRAAPRMPRSRALEQSASDRSAATQLSGAMLRRPRRTVRGGQRLHEDRGGTDRTLGTRALRDAGNRRLRTQRFACGSTRSFRSQSLLHRRRRFEGARGRRCARSADSCRRDRALWHRQRTSPTR